MSSHPLHHPIIVQELSWLCNDVPPIQKRTRELRLAAAALFAAMPQPSDPLLAARWLLAQISDGGEVNQVDRAHQTATSLAETSGDEGILIESLRSWIEARTQALTNQETRTLAEYDDRSVLVLYSRLATILNHIGDKHGEALTAYRCADFLKSHGLWDQAASMFASAARLYAAIDDKRSQGRCLRLQSASMTVIHFDPEWTKDRIKVMRAAIVCFTPGEDNADLAHAHADLAQLLPSGSDEALAELKTACLLFTGIGDMVQNGRTELNIADCLSHRRATASERKDSEAVERIGREQLAMLQTGLKSLAGAPPDDLIAYSAESLAQLDLELNPDRIDQGISEMITAANLRGETNGIDAQCSALERCAEICTEKGRKEKSAEIWKTLGDLAFAHRVDPEGPRWLDRAAAYYAKSGYPAPPLTEVVIDEARDQTQGREADRLSHLCQAEGKAASTEESKAIFEDIARLLGCKLSWPWVSDLWQCRKTWHLSVEDCRCLLHALSYPDCGLWAADFATQLGGRPGAELLVARMKELPDQSDRDIHRLNGMLYAVSRFAPDLARANVNMVLHHLTMDAMRLITKLLPEENLKPILMSSLDSQDLEVQIAALQILNRDAPMIDSGILRAIALRPILPWGPSREALHGLILQGRKENEPAILELLGDSARHSEVRTLAILGAGFLKLAQADSTLVALLPDPEYGSSAALALTAMGSRAHLETLHAWTTHAPVNQLDDRQVIAHTGLWCLTGADSSRSWLIGHLAQPDSNLAVYHVIRALGWGFGQRAADLMTEVLMSPIPLENWITPGGNRSLLERSLSRLELNADQLDRLEHRLGFPIPERCMDAASPNEFPLDEKPPAPLLVFRKPASAR